MKRGTALRPLLIMPVVAFVALCVLMGWKLTRPEDFGRTLNRPIPEFTLPAVAEDAPDITAAQLRQDTPLLLNAFASWCIPCRAEHPLLMELARQGVPVYGLAYKDTPAAAQRFLRDLGNPYRAAALDQQGKVAIELGLSGVPETYVIKRGQIVYHLAGVLTEEIYARDIQPLLRTP